MLSILAKMHIFVENLLLLCKYFADMKFIKVISAISGLFVFFSCARQHNDFVTITGYAQGGTYIVKLSLEGENGPLDVTEESLKEGIDSILFAIDNSVSGYNRNSLLTRFNAGERIRPDSIFVDIYSKSYEYWRMTGGHVDVSCGPLFDIWGFGFTKDSLPSEQQVNSILSNVGMKRLKSAMTLGSDGMISGADILLEEDGGELPKLNYNAIAQGYSCDLVAEYLISFGVRNMLVDVGGEMFCQGLNPFGKPWTLGLDRPVDGNNTPGEDLQGVFEAGPEPCGVVTSGNYRKFYIRDGKKYAHTVNPLTGKPVTHSLLSATVIAPDAALADALATYCMVVGLDEASEFISSRPGLECYLVYEQDGEMKSWSSEGFSMRE